MDQGHYRIFHFVIIKISSLIKSMFLFISLLEASSPNCIHLSRQSRDGQQYYGRDVALRQILLKVFGCILVLKRLRTEKTWTWARSAVKSELGKTVTYHRNNTKLHSKKNAKQNNFVAIAGNNEKERTQHMHIMQTSSHAKANVTQFFTLKFHCGLSNYYHFQRRSHIV